MEGRRNGWTDRWTDGCVERNKDIRMDEPAGFWIDYGIERWIISILLAGWMDG